MLYKGIKLSGLTFLLYTYIMKLQMASARLCRKTEEKTKKFMAAML
jgi:hypothetical protein